MKRNKAIVIIFCIALAVTLMLISLEAYYVAVAFMAGTLLFAHREVWSLLTKRRLPPFDERVKENIAKSIRNAFTFFVLALVFLMLPFTYSLLNKPEISRLLAGLLLSGGVVYLLSYFYFEKSAPYLGEKWLRWSRVSLMVIGLSAAAFVLGAFLHNALSSLFNTEEAVFFIIAVVLAPLGFITGLAGILIVFLKGLFSRSSGPQANNVD